MRWKREPIRENAYYKKTRNQSPLIDSSNAYRKPSGCTDQIRMLSCDSSDLQHEHERPDMKQKYMNTGKAQ